MLLRGLDIAAIPAADLHGAIVASAHGANVDTVIVDGEIVKRDGRLVGIDRSAVVDALAESRARLLAEAGAGAAEPPGAPSQVGCELRWRHRP